MSKELILLTEEQAKAIEARKQVSSLDLTLELHIKQEGKWVTPAYQALSELKASHIASAWLQGYEIVSVEERLKAEYDKLFRKRVGAISDKSILEYDSMLKGFRRALTIAGIEVEGIKSEY